MKAGLLLINCLDAHSEKLTESSYLSGNTLVNTEFVKEKAETIYLFIPTVLWNAVIACLNPKFKSRSHVEIRWSSYATFCVAGGNRNYAVNKLRTASST